MSEIILTWLNEQLQLSKRVSSFERDFTNGYLFGEILARYNQQLNFADFVNKDDKDSRIKNFTLLFETFRTLRIGFDSNLVSDIIEGKEGVSKKILYELKMQLQKSATNYFSKAPKSSLTPLKKVQVGKDIKDQVDAEFFKKRLQQTHRAQKRINQDNVLKKFNDFHKSQLEKNRQEMQDQQIKNTQVRDANREKLRNTLKRATDFRNQWERSNAEKWAKNMDVRNSNFDRDVLYKTKLEAIKKTSEKEKEEIALKQVSSEIQEFEKKFGKKQDDSDQENEGQPLSLEKKQSSVSPQRMTQTLKEKSQLGMTIPSSTLRIKRNPEVQEIYRRERDKRRRKMIVDQNKHQNLIEIEKRQQQILFSIQQTSKQQKQIQYQIWRAWQNKQVIIQNRKLRDSKYTDKAQTKQSNSRFKDQQLLRVYRQQHQQDLKNRLLRQCQLSSISKVSTRKSLYGQCQSMIFQLLNIAQHCYQHQQNTNNQDIHGEFLQQLIQQFVDQSKEQDTAEQEMKNYLEGKNNWNFVVARAPNQPQEVEKENAVPSEAVNNYYLGNILKSLFGRYYQEKGKEEEEGGRELGVCLLGLEFAGKKTLAEQIANEYNLSIISPVKLIQQRLKTPADSPTISQTTQQLITLCRSGSDIPNPLLVQLLQSQIKRHPRFLLLDFPLTYQQSVLLTKSLTSIIPKDHSKPSQLQSRIIQFSKLVKPTETTIIQRKIRSCGLDMIVWTDVGPEEALDRCIGRRWVGKQKEGESQKVCHIKEELEVDVNELREGDRGATIVEKNNFKINHVKDVKEWFMNFGVEVEDSYKFVCWQEINSRPKQDAVLSGLKQLMNKLLEYKSIYTNHLQTLKQKKAQAQQQHLQQQKKQQQIRRQCILTPTPVLQQHLSHAVSSTPLPLSFLTSCISLWSTIESNTLASYLKCFSGIRQQRQSSITKLANLKRRFIAQLTRQDNKFSIAKKFQLDYNRFVDGNRDMVEEEQTKEELHQRIEDLEDQLLEIIEGKREEAAEERNQVINSGWLESRLERFYMYIQTLVQVELERSLACQQLLTDFYTVTYSLESKQLPQPTSNDLTIDPALQIVNNEFQCPKVDKLFSQANRIFNREEPEPALDDKNKKGGKGGAPPPKKDDKKQGKKKEEVEEKKEPTKEELQMVAAVNTEKGIFRYRINILEQFAKRELKAIKKTAIQFYGGLEDLLKYTNQVEIEAVKRLSKLFRENVEKQAKIQTEIQINYVDVVVSNRVLNFENPKPIIQSAKEIAKPNRFSITQLKSIIKNISAQSEKFNRRIINRKLLTMLARFTVNKQTNQWLPQTWRPLTFDDYQRMAAILDYSKQGYILLKDLFTILILSDCQIPTVEQMGKYKKDLDKAAGGNSITKEKFAGVGAWFDQSQTQVKAENTNVFDRPAMLKKFLFEVLQDPESDTINVDRIIETLGLMRLKKKVQAGATYFDHVFK